MKVTSFVISGTVDPKANAEQANSQWIRGNRAGAIRSIHLKPDSLGQHQGLYPTDRHMEESSCIMS